DEARVRVARVRLVDRVEAGQRDRVVDLGVTVGPAAVGGGGHGQVHVLVDRLVAVVGIDDVVTAVAAERRDHLPGAALEQADAVVLQAAPDVIAAADVADGGEVVLERVQGGVQVAPLHYAHVAQRVRVHAAVVGGVQGAAGDGQRVLVGVDRARAGVLGRVNAPAGEREVPVRPGGRPGLARVVGLEDLFEVEEDVVVVARVDDDRL